ncbi:hypothetical protein Tco_1483137 [Tanacetum coccineum]
MEDGIIFNQSKYIKEMLKKFDWKIPNQPRRRCQRRSSSLKTMKPTPWIAKYRGMIGSLLYLTASRPDIMFNVCLCARFQENPKTTHLEAVKHIFRYIRGTSHSGLWYLKGTRIKSIVYADSDHVGNYIDRKSTSGGCAIDLSKNLVHHSRTKHIEIRHHFLPDNVQNGNISIEKVASEDNIADIFTKPLKREFQAIGLEPFLTLNKPICPRFVVEFYHSLKVKRDEELRPYIEFKLGQFTLKLTPSGLSRILQTPHTLETFYSSEWSLSSLDDHPNSNFFGPKHDIVKKAITVPRTTQAQLLRDPNQLYIDDIRPDLKGWELSFKENFF